MTKNRQIAGMAPSDKMVVDSKSEGSTWRQRQAQKRGRPKINTIPLYITLGQKRRLPEHSEHAGKRNDAPHAADNTIFSRWKKTTYKAIICLMKQIKSRKSGKLSYWINRLYIEHTLLYSAFFFKASVRRSTLSSLLSIFTFLLNRSPSSAIAIASTK